MATLTEATNAAPKNDVLKASQFASLGLAFCIHKVELVVGDFKGQTREQFELRVSFLYNGEARTQKIWLGADSTRKSIFRNPDPSKRLDLPYHNAMLQFDGSYLRLVDADPALAICPCQMHHKGQQNGEQSTEDILAEYGFQSPPASDSEKEAIVILAEALRKPIPANLDSMTTADAREWLQAAKGLPPTSIAS